MIEDTCGKVQVKGSPGLRGMSLKDIENLITNNIKNDDTLSSEFKRIKPKKGESKRMLYCAFMKNKLPDLWSKYIKGKEPVAAPPKAAPRTEVDEIFETLENLGFNVNEDEKEINYSGGDEAEEEPSVVPTIRNRRKERDPLAGKMAPALQARVNAKLRQMKRTGTPMPSFSNLRDKAVFVLAVNPKEFKTTQMKPTAANRVPRMAFATENNEMTMRLPTKPQKIPPPKKEFSREQVRTANKFANNVVNTIRGLTENNMRNVLKNRYPNTNVSALVKDIVNLGKNAEYRNLRELIRTKELSRMVPAGAPSRVGVGASFSALPSGMSLENRAVEIRKKKVANQTPREKQILRMMNRVRSARRGTAEPAVRMFTRTAGITINSNNNSPKRLAPLPKLLQKANNNNSSDSEPEEKNVVQKVKIVGPQTFIRGKNVNAMTSDELLVAAKMLANKVMPGKKVDFKANNKSRLQRVVKAAAKKYISMS